MRVIAGSARGRSLQTIRSTKLKPTTDRVKGSLFSMLESLDVCFQSVLDLYAGTGALGIEAISRGAHSVVFVENNYQHSELIKKNLHTLSMSDQATILTMDAEKSLQRFKSQDKPFTVVFADPPYANQERVAHIMKFLVTSPAMVVGGVFAVEHATQTDPIANLAPGWMELRKRKYGSTSISIYQKERNVI
ncbi:MAG: 16S rRNA (guanine(966)-N(2))-methyltransferase RsmD [SAR202 cluster bacterium]|nr:16S rRNA (guanine(966)-N(2))-methyltransferase RsmD [SAR202 cluster bacterium]|tara:strand:- start:81 stop:653 length:573 start_codon:yes stop_codon:yes gene_type:complete